MEGAKQAGVSVVSTAPRRYIRQAIQGGHGTFQTVAALGEFATLENCCTKSKRVFLSKKRDPESRKPDMYRAHETIDGVVGRCEHSALLFTVWLCGGQSSPKHRACLLL